MVETRASTVDGVEDRAEVVNEFMDLENMVAGLRAACTVDEEGTIGFDLQDFSALIQCMATRSFSLRQRLQRLWPEMWPH